jgi:hypothetical protein
LAEGERRALGGEGLGGCGLDAALDGDVVLVRPGTYAGFTIDQKGVSILAEKALDLRLDAAMQRVEMSNSRGTRSAPEAPCA